MSKLKASLCSMEAEASSKSLKQEEWKQLMGVAKLGGCGGGGSGEVSNWWW